MNRCKTFQRRDNNGCDHQSEQVLRNRAKLNHCKTTIDRREETIFEAVLLLLFQSFYKREKTTKWFEKLAIARYRLPVVPDLWNAAPLENASPKRREKKFPGLIFQKRRRQGVKDYSILRKKLGASWAPPVPRTEMISTILRPPPTFAPLQKYNHIRMS